MTTENKQPIAERVNIYDTDDDKLRELGEVLVTDTSRRILKLLFEKTMTANEIATATEFSLQLVRYHIKKCKM